MRTFDYQRATSTPQALAGPADQRSFLAGGTTLLDLVKLDVMQPRLVTDINHLPLAQVEATKDGGVRVGALVTNTQLANHPLIRQHYPLLSQAILAGASTQLRNKATTGGNLMQRVRCNYFRDNVSPCNKREPGSGCSAIEGHNRSVHAVLGTSADCIAAHPSDMCVAMVAIGGTVHVEGPKGRRDIILQDFHLLPGRTPWLEHALQPDELITHVTLDPPLSGFKSCYVKLRDRDSYQFALASSAALLVVHEGRIAQARIALGGVATKPWRATQSEAALIGQAPSAAVFETAARAAFSDARTYSQNAYKVQLGQQAIMRSLRDALA